MSPRPRGIDVSSVQGVVAWKAVADAGISFAYIKATEGNAIVDHRFAQNVDGALAAGLRVGAYHFLGPKSPVGEPVEKFRATVVGLGLNMPPVVDFEYPEPEQWGGRGPELVIRCIDACTGIEAVVGKPMIYSYPYFLGSLPRSEDQRSLARWPLWIASYKTGRYPPTEQHNPVVPGPWAVATCWQWVGNGGPGVPGIAMSVDQNVWLGDLPNLEDDGPEAA
jgi:lysozyme